MRKFKVGDLIYENARRLDLVLVLRDEEGGRFKCRAIHVDASSKNWVTLDKDYTFTRLSGQIYIGNIANLNDILKKKVLTND